MKARIPHLTGLFGTFLSLGLTAFGGLAMIEPLRRRVVEEQGWLSPAEFLDGVAFCQLLPGATVVQLAAYVGQRLRGPAGAVAAAAAFILPAFVLMTALSWLYLRFGHLSWATALSRGLSAAVIALLLQALGRLGRDLCRTWPEAALAGAAFGAFGWQVHYLAVFGGAGLAGLIFSATAGPGAPKAPAAPESRESSPRVGLFVGLGVGAAGLLWGVLRLYDPLLAQLAALMAKVGLISFGGGYVMIPVLQWEVVERLGWLSLPQFLDGLLLSYVTPGPLIILAAFIGFLVQGLHGAALATGAIFLPPILLVISLSPAYRKIKSSRWVRPFIRGVLAALVGMLAWTTLTVARSTLTEGKSWLLMVGAAAALMGFNVPLIWVIAAVAALSLLIF